MFNFVQTGGKRTLHINAEEERTVYSCQVLPHEPLDP